MNRSSREWKSRVRVSPWGMQWAFVLWTLLLGVAVIGPAHAQSEADWLSYDEDADIKVIDDGLFLGNGPDLVLDVDDLSGAQIIYGNPTLIRFPDGSQLTLRRYTRADLQQEFGEVLQGASEAFQISDIPRMMFSREPPPSPDPDSRELIEALRAEGQRLVRELDNPSNRFHTQRYTTQLWFVLGDRSSLAFITQEQLPNQYVLVRGENMDRGDFIGHVVHGALQPRGSDWNDERRRIPQQHLIPLPK